MKEKISKVVAGVVNTEDWKSILDLIETPPDNKMGDLTFTLPSDRTYMSMAWLMESNGKKDADAQNVKDAFAPYAYNFITGTKTSFTQNGAEIKTTY